MTEVPKDTQTTEDTKDIQTIEDPKDTQTTEDPMVPHGTQMIAPTMTIEAHVILMIDGPVISMSGPEKIGVEMIGGRGVQMTGVRAETTGISDKNY